MNENGNMETCTCSSKRLSVTECISIQRLIVVMKFYSTIKDEEDLNISEPILTHHINEEYHNGVIGLLDDFSFFLCDHSIDDVEEIQSIHLLSFAACLDLSECASIGRHFRDRSFENENEMQTAQKTISFTVYSDVLDKIHFYFNHLFQAAFKLKRAEKEIIEKMREEEKEDEEEEENKALKEIKHIIAKKMKQMKGRMKNDGKNKFNLMNTAQNNEKPENDNTTIDYLWIKCAEKGLCNKTKEKLSSYFAEEEFDSDAIHDDFEPNLNESNINEWCSMKQQQINPKEIQLIYSFMKDTKCMCFLYPCTEYFLFT